MKTILKITIFTIILLNLTFVFASCKKENPVEIPFTEYSLTGTSCQWTNLDYNESVIIINSNKELEKYINCTNSGSYLEIDFSKYTLLLVNGRSLNNITSIEPIRLIQYSNRRYDIKIVIRVGIAGLAESWTCAILAPKISNNAKITKKVEYTYHQP